MIGDYAVYYGVDPVNVLKMPWVLFLCLLNHRQTRLQNEAEAAKKWQAQRK
jgi:hypothetical protein